MKNRSIKELVGSYAVDRELEDGFLHSGTSETPFCVGLGTGSTAIWAVRRLAYHVEQGTLAHVVGVATSSATQLEAQKCGITVSDLNNPLCKNARVQWAFDGADQVSPEGYLIKGGGAAHAREKVIAHAAERFIILVDEIKMVALLGGDPGAGTAGTAASCSCGGPQWKGNAFAVPVEVLPMALSSVIAALSDMGARAVPREVAGKIGPVVSDNGLYIVDAIFPQGLVVGTSSDPVALEMAIKMLPGVLEVGIFTNRVNRVYVGMPDGSVQARTMG